MNPEPERLSEAAPRAWLPRGYPCVSPYVLVADVAGLVGFLIATFEAQETLRHPRPDGSIGHAEVRIGDSVIMMGSPTGSDWSPTPAWLYVYVPDVNATYERALRAGATPVQEPQSQYYGDRVAAVRDPFGNVLWIATHVEDVSPEEMERRAQSRPA